METTTEPTPLDTLIEDRLVILEALAIARRRYKPTLEKELTRAFESITVEINNYSPYIAANTAYMMERGRKYGFQYVSCSTPAEKAMYNKAWHDYKRYAHSLNYGGNIQSLGRTYRVSNYQPQAINSTELEQQVAKRIQKKMKSLKDIVNKKESWINLFDTKPIKKSLKGKTKAKLN